MIQIAKGEGLKVIACAGSQDKVEYLKSLGVDAAFNYKTEDADAVLKREGPIDVYVTSYSGESI